MDKSKFIDVSSGISPLGPSKKVRAALRKALKNIKNYPDPDAIRLKRLFTSKFGIQKEGILFANSVEELVYLITSVFRPKRVLVVGPALRIYEGASYAVGAETEYVTSDDKSDFIPDKELIKNKMNGVDLLFIANPNRITGRLTSRYILEEIFDNSALNSVRIIMDESLIEFTDDDSYSKKITDMNNIVILRTTSLFYGLPGLELAYAVGFPPVISELAKGLHWSLNHLALEAARTALRDNTYRKLTKRYINDEKKYIKVKIKKADGIKLYSSDSNILLIKLEFPAGTVFDLLEKEGFIIKDCKEIEGLNSSLLRFSVMKHENNTKFFRILSSYL